MGERFSGFIFINMGNIMTSKQELITDFDMELTEEERALIEGYDDGADSDSMPRARVSKGAIGLLMGASEQRHQNLKYVIIGVKPQTYRELTDQKYDPKNTVPPSCYSLDGEKPHETANPPQILDMVTGKPRRPKDCSECSGERNGQKCTYKKHMVCGLENMANEQGLFTFTIPAMSAFHGGDLLDNDRPDQQLGLIKHLERMKNIPTKSGKPVKTVQLFTTSKILAGKQMGEAATFSFNAPDGSIMQVPVREAIAYAKLSQTDYFAKLMDSYEQYLLQAGRYWAKKRAENEGDQVSEEPAAPVSMDEIEDDLADVKAKK